jgi:hypothetical protein
MFTPENLMKLTRLAALFLIFIGTLSLAQSNPQPLLYPSLSPVSTSPGGPAFTLTVGGFGFVPGAVVQWNGSPRTTTFVSSSSLQAAINASDIATAGTAFITVLNPAPGGGTSNSVFFSVTTPEDTISLALDSSSFSSSTAGDPIVIADFNGDGILDVLASETVSGRAVVAFYQSNGNGTFQPPVYTPTYFGASSFLVGDLNGDGKPDVIISGYSGFSPASLVLLNNGDGSFKQISASPYGSPVVLGDFTGDGNLDAIAEVCSLGFCNIDISVGDGKGGFPHWHYIDADYSGSIEGSMVVGDFNGDGKLDFAVSDGLLFFGNGDGTFQDPITVPNMTGNYMLAADLNGDGNLDLVVTEREGGFCVLLGNGNGTFNPNCSTKQFGSFVLGDFNGDGKLDIASASNGIEILLGNGDGTFQNAIITDADNSPGQVGDFLGNGRLDFAATSNSGISLYLQSPASISPFSLTYGTYSVGQTSPAQSVTLSNTGTTALKVDSAILGGTNPGDFSFSNPCKVIQPGSSCTVSVAFKPTTFGYRTASLTVTYGTSPKTSQIVQLSGTGQTTNAAFSPNTLAFPILVVGTTSSPMTSTLTNSGPGVLTITNFTATGPYAFTTNCGSTLAVNASCQVVITFTPTTTGFFYGAVTATTNAQNGPVVVGLTGTGSNLLVSPLTINFGNQAVGTTSAPVTVTLTNVSNNSYLHLLPVTITGNNKNDFSQTNNCGTKLGPGASCTVTVTFTPTATGARSASLNTDGYEGVQAVALSGTGT